MISLKNYIKNQYRFNEIVRISQENKSRVYDKSVLLGINFYYYNGGRRGRDRDRMVVGFPTTCAISAYHH